jgi:hypothetical protein
MKNQESEVKIPPKQSLCGNNSNSGRVQVRKVTGDSRLTTAQEMLSWMAPSLLEWAGWRLVE